MSVRVQVKALYALAKPGIIYGNALTTIGGFLLASKGHFNALLFVVTLIASSFVIASGCIFNNYFDREIDAKMKRTKNRALVTGSVSVLSALITAALLGIGGIGLLAWYTNLLTVCIGLIGFIVYVVIYAIFKRRSTYGTLVGSIAGAVPPLAGYCAVTGRFDMGALILFLIVALWQMPHFYGIAMYRLNDYEAADIPVLPRKRGMHVTKVHSLIYLVLFMVCVVALTLFGFAGYTYLIVMLALSLWWLWIGLRRFKAENDIVWGRSLFRFSLIVITAFSVLLSLTAFLP